MEQCNDCASIGDANNTALLDALSKVRTEKSAETFSNVTDLTSVDDLQVLFIDFLQKQKSPLARLWLSYMEMVSRAFCCTLSESVQHEKVLGLTTCPLLQTSFLGCSLMTTQIIAVTYLCTGVRCIC